MRASRNAAFTVYYELFDYIREYGKYPTQAELCEFGVFSKVHVSRCVAFLRKWGLLQQAPSGAEVRLVPAKDRLVYDRKIWSISV